MKFYVYNMAFVYAHYLQGPTFILLDVTIRCSTNYNMSLHFLGTNCLAK